MHPYQGDKNASHTNKTNTLLSIFADLRREAVQIYNLLLIYDRIKCFNTYILV